MFQVFEIEVGNPLKAHLSYILQAVTRTFVFKSLRNPMFIIFERHFRFPALRRCPQGGFRRVESDVRVTNSKFLDPETEK